MRTTLTTPAHTLTASDVDELFTGIGEEAVILLDASASPDADASFTTALLAVLVAHPNWSISVKNPSASLRTSLRVASAASPVAARLVIPSSSKAVKESPKHLGLLLIALPMVIVVGILIAATFLSHAPAHSKRTAPASEQIIRALHNIPASTFDAVSVDSTMATPVSPRPISGASLDPTSIKPTVLYVGAEWCPFCAAERWPLIAALSRFGTFSDLKTAYSSATDVYPNTPTMSFAASQYHSAYLNLQAVETATATPNGKGGYTPLGKLTSAQTKIMSTYDLLKYTGQHDGAIPFLDIGGRWVLAGAGYSPQILADITQRQIATSLADSQNPLGKVLLTQANILTAALCQITKGQPGSVCTSKAVTAAAPLLHG